jgi:hypothetical protein
MRSTILAASAAGVIATVALLGLATGQRNQEDLALQRRERAQLRAHFDSVLAELRERDVSGLRMAQREARGRLILALERYRDGGIFPHNHDFPGERVPYFRDRHGTLCAMAYLVATTGRNDIVDAVAERANNAYIAELAADARLRAWLDSVGLTAAEAARIQPEYQGRPIARVADEARPARSVVPSLALGVPAVITTILNWRAPREKRADGSLLVGALTGAAAAILGGAILADERDGQMAALGVADVAVGSAAIVSVVRRSLRLARTAGPHPPVAAAQSRLTLDVIPRRRANVVSPAVRVRIRM